MQLASTVPNDKLQPKEIADILLTIVTVKSMIKPLNWFDRFRSLASA